MATPLQERIERLREKQARDRAQLERLESRAKQADRKRDLHRKIVVGAAILEEMEADPAFATRIRKLLDKRVVKPSDREVLSSLLPQAPVMDASEDQSAQGAASEQMSAPSPKSAEETAASQRLREPPADVRQRLNPDLSSEIHLRFAGLTRSDGPGPD